jgi:hypothetical protein
MNRYFHLPGNGPNQVDGVADGLSVTIHILVRGKVVVHPHNNGFLCVC